MNEFINLNINESIVDALTQIDILKPTPIQEKSIPYLLEGKDVIGQAQTGTGKTFAYAIPLLEKLDFNSKRIQALVMCPTRELSLQVSKEIKKLASKISKIRVATIYGGESYEKQFKSLSQKPQVIIGTPGRIIDHLNRGTISFDTVSYLVLDEADEMLKMGFQEDMETILSKMPEERQTALFSATLPPTIKAISKSYMDDPVMVKIENKTLTVDAIDQYFYYVKKEQKKDLLIRLLDYYNFKSVMIFANTKAMVDELVLFLQENKFSADGLHGDLKQANRDRVMQSFRLSSIDILIATDVAARGIDVSGVEAIINYDLPLENEIYVHRIGRTGRAGMRGIAISLATTRQQNRISELEKYIKSNIKMLSVPSEKDILAKREDALYNMITDGVDFDNYELKYKDLLFKLSRKTTDPTPIIIKLIDMIASNTERVYNPIDSVKPKEKTVKPNHKDDKKRNSNHKDSKPNKKEESSNKMVVLELNVGSNDKIRANQLINFFNTEIKVHREHFGKIVIDKNITYVHVKEIALKFFKDLNKKTLNGKKIKYKRIS